MKNIALKAKKTCAALSLLKASEKEKALQEMASAVLADREAILRANRRDVEAAKKKGLSSAMVARLTLDEAKLEKIAESIGSISHLPDPVGRVLWERTRPNGLVIRKISVPLGSILIIYESRPNVTADCMALCLRSGNSVILKGGSEALRTNQALFDVMTRAAAKAGIPRDAFQLVRTSDRSAVRKLLRLVGLIDLVIPRGGEGLIREVTRLSKIPVIKHTKGVCHLFVDQEADLEKAERILINAKTQNPAVCNALECLLVHEEIAGRFLPAVAGVLAKKQVEVHADPKARALIPGAKKATPKDWGREYLELVLAVRVVKDVHEAIAHIQRYGSGHSDAIVTENRAHARLFTDSVDSSAVFVNASTRFNDGGEFGMGAEMGISTDKLHARGPMGLEELTSYKYVVLGNGQTRE